MPTFIDMPLDDPRLGKAFPREKCRKGLHAWEEDNIVVIRSSTSKGGFSRTCRACFALNVSQRQRYRKKSYRRTSSFYRYNLLPEQYDALVMSSEGRCGVCLEPSKDLHIDHDHACCPTTASSTKRSCGACVRGLLCERCNFGLGCFKDDQEVLLRAVAYLDNKH